MVDIRFGEGALVSDGAKLVHKTIVALIIASDQILYGGSSTTSFGRVLCYGTLAQANRIRELNGGQHVGYVPF